MKSYGVTELELAGALEMALDALREVNGPYDPRFSAAQLIFDAWLDERWPQRLYESSAAPDESPVARPGVEEVE